MAMESQYETAGTMTAAARRVPCSLQFCITVFALNERESGAVTESMLQRQKQLRAHVREVEQALRERQEDEASAEPMRLAVGRVLKLMCCCRSERERSRCTLFSSKTKPCTVNCSSKYSSLEVLQCGVKWMLG